MRKLVNNIIIIFFAVFLLVSCSRQKHTPSEEKINTRLESSKYIGRWRISRYPTLDNLCPPFDGDFNPLYSGYFDIDSNGTLYFDLKVSSNSAHVFNDGFWNLSDDYINTRLHDQDNGGYVHGKMYVAGNYLIYEVDGTPTMYLVKS